VNETRTLALMVEMLIRNLTYKLVATHMTYNSKELSVDNKEHVSAEEGRTDATEQFQDELVQDIFRLGFGTSDSDFLPSMKIVAADPKDEVTDESIKDYSDRMEIMRDNKATNQETVDSFKRAAKALRDFDEKSLQKELERGAKDRNVHSLTVLMHLKEVLEKNGWKKISFQPGAEAGSVILKNDKTETYIEMQFSRKKGSEGADVKIRKNQ
jgi:hypothetical protein